jgi:hypothetical protein
LRPKVEIDRNPPLRPIYIHLPSIRFEKVTAAMGANRETAY